jgi:hypothetical protein
VLAMAHTASTAIAPRTATIRMSEIRHSIGFEPGAVGGRRLSCS